MAKKFRVGIVGCGGIANGKHLPALTTLDNVEIVYFCDIIKERAEEAKEKYGTPDAKVTENYMDVVNSDVDTIHVCTPNRSHCEISCAAMEAGKHVLCEKPMAINAEEGRRLVEAEKESSAKLMIIQNQRFIPAAQYIRRMFKEGKFGEVYHIRTGWRRPLGMMPSDTDLMGGVLSDRSWYNKKAANGGVLRDLGVHLLDLAMFITDFPEIESVSAASSGITFMSLLVSGFMVVCHIISGSFSPRPLERCRVYFLLPIFLRISAFSNSS